MARRLTGWKGSATNSIKGEQAALRSRNVNCPATAHSRAVVTDHHPCHCGAGDRQPCTSEHDYAESVDERLRKRRLDRRTGCAIQTRRDWHASELNLIGVNFFKSVVWKRTHLELLMQA